MSTLTDTRFKLRLLGFRGLTLKRGEVKVLQQVLHEDESILQAVFGSYESGYGLLVATTQRVIFIDTKLFHSYIFDTPYDGITSIEYDTTVFTANITIHVGANTVKLCGLRKNRAMEVYTCINDLLHQQRPISEMQPTARLA